jgi:CheY-like chemotaxis protein
VSDRSRILVLGDAGPAGGDWLSRFQPGGELVYADSWARGLELLRRQHFDAVLANPGDAGLLGAVRELIQSQRILATVPDGLAVVDFDLKVRWANPTFEGWCNGPAAGRGFYEALGSPDVVGPDYCPFHTALANAAGVSPAERPPRPVTATRLLCRDNRHIDLHITPILDQEDARGPLLIALGRDVTAMVQQQQKLDALHRAGAVLAALSPEQLADMSAAERIELLKLNIRKFTRDLLHYDVVEVRLLDRQTGQLELLLQEGMIPEAVGRQLRVGMEGQGVTGYVAATGKSYLCPDTTADPLYLPGAPGAHSSLTVPLLYQEQVIGTFNVESPRVNAFGENDLQFVELFGREIAAALHTLELLSAEKSTTVTQSVEAVSREVALPVDEILNAATSVLERYIGHDPEIADKLKRILAGARQIKECIHKVGEDIAPAPPAAGAKPAAPASLKGMRVLVADNDDRVRRSAHGLLGRWGCVVETARDGQEALTMARLGTYDAILADIRLPDVPGYEMFLRLREAQPQARVILMTGYGYDPAHTLVKARRDGLRCVLFKPFRVDQLLSALAPPVVQNSEGGVPAGPEAKLPAASGEAR